MYSLPDTVSCQGNIWLRVAIRTHRVIFSPALAKQYVMRAWAMPQRTLDVGNPESYSQVLRALNV